MKNRVIHFELNPLAAQGRLRFHLPFGVRPRVLPQKSSAIRTAAIEKVFAQDNDSGSSRVMRPGSSHVDPGIIEVRVSQVDYPSVWGYFDRLQLLQAIGEVQVTVWIIMYQ